MNARICESTSFVNLLGKARGGDRAALNDLLEIVRPWMKQIAARAHTNRPEYDRSDVVQDTQLLIARNIGKFDGNSAGEFYTWVRVSLERVVISRQRGVKRAVHLPGELAADARLPAGPETPSAEFIRRESRQNVRDALARLFPDDQNMIRLRHYAGLEFTEIAAVLGIKADTARQRHARALKRLDEQLRLLGTES